MMYYCGLYLTRKYDNVNKCAQNHAKIGVESIAYIGW
jgi:hypothetical protein